MDIPIACALAPGPYRARIAHLADLAHRALRSRASIEGGERLTFVGGGEIADELAAVVAAEASCCAFLTFVLRQDDEDVMLDITGPEDARPVIAELFGWRASPAGQTSSPA